VRPAGRAEGPGPRRLYIANDDHTGYYWSGDADDFRGAFVRILASHMAPGGATEDGPADSRGRFNADGSLWVREYERARPREAFPRTVRHPRARGPPVRRRH